MKTMGIDSASKLSGIAILDGKKLVYSEQYNSLLLAKACDNNLAKALDLFKKNLIKIHKLHKPDLWIVETCGLTRNATTFRLLSYFEAATLLAAHQAKAKIIQARVLTVRKEVLKSGDLSKANAVARVAKKYKNIKTDDEADAIVLALYGNGEVL